MLYVIQLCRQLSSRTWSSLKAVYKTVWHITLPGVQLTNSWWWAEELPEICRVSWQNKFGKLVRLVGFIVNKFVTMHGHMSVNSDWMRSWKSVDPKLMQYNTNQHFLPNERHGLGSFQIHRAAKFPSILQLTDILSRLIQLHSNSPALPPSYVCLQPKVPIANWLTKENLSHRSLFRVWTWNASKKIRTLSSLLISLVWF
jgi:hypothetical protein